MNKQELIAFINEHLPDDAEVGLDVMTEFRSQTDTTVENWHKGLSELAERSDDEVFYAPTYSLLMGEVMGLRSEVTQHR